MLGDSIKTLIREEYTRHGADFIAGVELDSYLARLDERAEIVSDSVAGRCRGFVAYYCNDAKTKQAYITLVLVDPRDRGQGVGKALVRSVLDAARSRGFTSCRLEVSRRNEAAYAMYLSLGFHTAESRDRGDLLEIAL